MKKKLVAEALHDDPRVAEAKKLLLDAVKEHQSKITAIRPPLSSHKQSYDQMLDAFASYRGSKLWFPYIGSGIGNGPLVELLDGSVKYDFINGIGVHYFGHSNPAIIASSIDAAITDTVMQGNLQQNKEAVELSEILLKESGMDHCILTTSGAMANENAFKIAFQKRSPANRILAFEHCFAGRTLLLSQITDKPSYREGLPSSFQVDYIPYFDPNHPEESIKKSKESLENYLKRYPKQHAAMIFEMVLGENGFYPGNKEFFVSLMKILKEHDITIIVDEVQTFGRTPSLFAFQHFGLDKYPDIITIGKLSHVCATLFKKNHLPKPGLISQTFTSSTAALKASYTIIKELLEGNYYGPKGKISQIYNHFSSNLKDIAERNDNLISGPYGIGTMIAFTPFDGELERTTKFAHALFDAGVLSFIAGSNPTRIRFLVPIITSLKDIDNVSQIIESTGKKLC